MEGLLPWIEQALIEEITDMVKVVGKDEKAVKRITCKNCASILEFTKSETRRVKYGDYSGDSWYENIINCPVCNEEIKT